MILLLNIKRLVIILAFLFLSSLNSSAQEELLKTLESKYSTPGVRKNAITIMVSKNEPKVIPVLIKIMKDTKEEEALRKKAISALAEFKAIEGIVPLGEVLTDTEDSYLLKPDIIKALEKIGGERAKKVLLTAFLANLNNPEITDETLAALGKMKGRLPVEFLGPALMHENDQVVKAALKIIKISRDVSALPVLMPLLDKKNSEIRKEVLNIAALLGSSDIIPAFILRLEDEDASFRALLADFLDKLPPKTMKPFYYKEFDRLIEKETNKEIKEKLVKARKRFK